MSASKKAHAKSPAERLSDPRAHGPLPRQPLAERGANLPKSLARIANQTVKYPDPNFGITIATHNYKALKVLNDVAAAKWRQEWAEYKLAHRDAVDRDRARREQYLRETFERQRLSRLRGEANQQQLRKIKDAEWAVHEEFLCRKRDAKYAAEKAERNYQLNYLIKERAAHWPGAIGVSPALFEREVDLEGFWPEPYVAPAFGRDEEGEMPTDQQRALADRASSFRRRSRAEEESEETTSGEDGEQQQQEAAEEESEMATPEEIAEMRRAVADGTAPDDVRDWIKQYDALPQRPQ